MKHKLKLLSLSTLLLCLFQAGAFTAVPGFIQNGGATVWNGPKYAQKLLFGKAPDGKPAWQLSWNRELRAFAEIGFTKPFPLNCFEQLGIRLSYYSSGRGDLEGCGIRIEDSTGEIFQYEAQANDHVPGWKTIGYDITPDNFKSSWGGNNDRKIDFPAKLIGFGAGFAPGSIGPVWLGEVKYEIPQRTGGVLSVESMWSFHLEKERWWVGGREYVSSAAELPVKSSGKQKIRLDECMNVNRYYENLRSLRFTADLRKGKKAIVTVIFRDSRNRELASAPIVFTGGRQTVAGAVPAAAGALRVKEAYVEFPDGGGELVLQKAESVSEKPLLAAINMELETGSPIYVMRPGEFSGFAIVLINTTGQEINADASFTFSDIFENSFRIERKLTLKPGRTERLPVKLPEDLKMGIWYVTCQLSSPGETSTQKVRSFACMQPAGPTKERLEIGKPTDFLYGICNAPDRWSVFAAQMDALSAAAVGAKVFRTATPWSYISRKEGEWDYGVFDRLVSVFGEQGIELQALIAGVPRWAIDPDAPLRKDQIDPRGSKMPKLKPFREYVYKTALRYKGKIRLWEIGNEPDHPGFAAYGPDGQAKLQTAAFEEIRKADPSIRVMTGGFAGITGNSFRYQYETLGASRGKFDLHAIHLHGPFSSYHRQIDNELRELQSKLGIENIPWYPNETAHHSTGGNEKVQAESLYTKLVFSRARGAVGFTWYNMRDVGFNEMDNEHNYGMQKADFYPKAVFPAYAALVNTFRGFAFHSQLSLQQGEFGFLFRNGNDFLLAGWKTGDAVNSGGCYSLETDGSRAEQIDLMGNATPVTIDGGRIFWTFDNTPVTLKIYGATKVSAKPVIDCNVSGCAVPGRKVAVQVNLANPFPRELVARLTLTTPAEFKVEPGSIALKLAPGEQIVKSFILNCTSAVSGTFGNKYLVELKVDLDKNGTTRLLLPVHSSAVMSQEIDKKKPDFVLNQRRQVRVLYDNVPNRPFWTGPKDLSAEIKLGMDRNDLIIKVKVEDDIHLQRQEAPECWREDSVQLALWLPGMGGWEIGGAHKDGKTLKHIWLAPEKANIDKALQALTVTSTRQGTVTDYEFRLPFAAFGLTFGKLKAGFRFNLVVNDADEPNVGREGWAMIAPGIADTKDPSLYPFIVFK